MVVVVCVCGGEGRGTGGAAATLVVNFVSNNLNLSLHVFRLCGKSIAVKLCSVIDKHSLLIIRLL